MNKRFKQKTIVNIYGATSEDEITLEKGIFNPKLKLIVTYFGMFKFYYYIDLRYNGKFIAWMNLPQFSQFMDAVNNEMLILNENNHFIINEKANLHPFEYKQLEKLLLNITE